AGRDPAGRGPPRRPPVSLRQAEVPRADQAGIPFRAVARRGAAAKEMTMPTTLATKLPVPGFYDPTSAARWDFRPDLGRLPEAAGRWRERHAIRPSGSDKARVQLLLIDVQKDFCFPEGTLYVGGRSGRGAIEDNDRIARFVYENLGTISEVTCTMDTHFPFQI